MFSGSAAPGAERRAAVVSKDVWMVSKLFHLVNINQSLFCIRNSFFLYPEYLFLITVGVCILIDISTPSPLFWYLSYWIVFFCFFFCFSFLFPFVFDISTPSLCDIFVVLSGARSARYWRHPSAHLPNDLEPTSLILSLDLGSYSEYATSLVGWLTWRLPGWLCIIRVPNPCVNDKSIISELLVACSDCDSCTYFEIVFYLT